MSSVTGKVDLSSVNEGVTDLLNRLTVERAVALSAIDAMSGRVVDIKGKSQDIENIVELLPVSPIKSIQRGVKTLSGATSTATISAVNTSKAMLSISGGPDAGASGVRDAIPTAQLTSGTEISFRRGTTGGNAVISWEVIEYV
ncbi:MAG: hypothetical protein CME39_09735 [Haliea sp.]|nr:hypothetical protein [Haliea sp.]|tara:strand:- start:450 stop:878 length:429 start_codon:yes stop_codon:yes gene_type:complete